MGETSASGTGACGAAVAHVLRGGDSPVTVRLDGGELVVDVDEGLHIDLTGWAEPVYAGDQRRAASRALAATAVALRTMTKPAWGAGLATVLAADEPARSTPDFPAPALGDGRAEPRSPRQLARPPVSDVIRGTRAGVDDRRRSTTWTRRRPTSHDAYLRLHLLSHRLVRPHAINLDGIFGVLPNVAWTSLGPGRRSASSTAARLRARAAGVHSACRAVDKFPRMTDYVVPSGVRIADADRVRLGAHLAEGTTVMHEGFVNYNAGTLGASMVEGRISAGVVVGDGSDIGGGASIMGTLSGGGTEVISIGERCLLGANSGLGISLGDDCVVEAGLYVTAGTRVTLPDGEVVKAARAVGRAACCSAATAQTARSRPPAHRRWGGLNAALHAND